VRKGNATTLPVFAQSDQRGWFCHHAAETLEQGMIRSRNFFATLTFLTVAPMFALDQQPVSPPAEPPPPSLPPSENRYDVLSKMIRPMAGVLLGGEQTTDRAMTLKATVGQVAGRLPQAIQGASFTARIEYPGRIRVEAPVLGETMTVCRNGNQVWAVPGSKIQFLLGQFQNKPRPQSRSGSPLQLPFTAQQAVLLPALFQLEKSGEIADLGGTPCRVISGGLIPEIGKAANAEDFSAKLWICADYTPRRIDIRRSDFAMSFLIGELTYAPRFAPSTWQPPQGATDVFRCDAGRLEELLYVLMNSLQMSAEDKPWLNEAGAQVPAVSRTPSQSGRSPGPVAEPR
jgi:hypothetical protein